MTKIKICGISSIEVAEKILDLKPDSIGIYIDKEIGANSTTLDVAKEIAKMSTIAGVESFLLTDEKNANAIKEMCGEIRNSHVQLRDDITVEEIKKLRTLMPTLQIVKVISVTGEETVVSALPYQSSAAVDQLLLDSKVGNQRGGTGKTHDWNISKMIVEQSSKPVWLAGGIKLETVHGAIEKVQPYGIDVETGVQNSDGSKNYEVIREFIVTSHLSN